MRERVVALVNGYETPKMLAFSRRYPAFKGLIIFLRCFVRAFQNTFVFRIGNKKQDSFYENIIARHQSVLRRKLGDSDPRLQENKITNLHRAVEKLNGLVIKPGKIFSFWHTVGRPSYKNGYVDGMLLSGGNVVEGVGGGLCQLANFLYWIFLHTQSTVMERHHHSFDVFPDSGRVLPFGSGATVLYNYIDLKIRNDFEYPVQLKIWITDSHLKGQILSVKNMPVKFHVIEKNHCFIKSGNNAFRYNEIYRETKIDGELTKTEKVTTNFSPVLYEITEDYIRENNFEVIDCLESQTKGPELQIPA